MKRVLALITDLARGGAETQLVHLVTQLRIRGWEVRVVSILPPQAYVEDLEAAGVLVHSLGMYQVPDPRSLFRLVTILRRYQPQVVHSHMFHANLLARVVRHWARVPVLICTAHSTYEASRRAKRLREVTWREWAYRLTDPLCDLTTQICQAGLDRYVRVKAVPPHKIRVIPNGIDTERFRPDPVARKKFRGELGLNAFTWLAVGRFEEAKDYPNMLRAFAKVVEDRKEAMLLIAGQGALREEAEWLAGELGVASRKRFLGVVRKDLPELMNAADAYVMSSAWEGMPMVLLEASATELPIVATDVGGNREVVLDGKTGFLVPPNDPEALAQAMLRLMGLSEEERRRMGKLARQHIETNYSLDRVVDQWEALYRELLAKKGIQVG